MTDLISPRLFSSLSGFYPQKCTIQEATEPQDAYGQPIKAWSNLAGHIDIACRVAPTGGGDRRAAQQVYTVATHEIYLAGSFPAITAKMRAVVDGKAFDILLPRSDGSGCMSQLVCRVVT